MARQSCQVSFELPDVDVQQLARRVALVTHRTPNACDGCRDRQLRGSKQAALPAELNGG